MNESRIEIPHSFYVDTGKASKTIDRLGNFDRPNKEVLNRKNLEALSFNFFVQWNEDFSDGRVVHEVWIKRLVSLVGKERVGVEDIVDSDVAGKLEELEGKEHIISAVNTMKAINIKLRYLLIFNKRITDDTSTKAFIGFFMDYSLEDNCFYYEYLSLNKLKAYIKAYTGRSLKIGKGLKVAETYLEAYLSKTDTPFPGDCDELIFNRDGIKVLIEYKKSTSKDKLQVIAQSYKRYYKDADRLKYIRLNIIRKYITQFSACEVPLINVLYSVEETDKKIKIEKIGNNLDEEGSAVFDVEEKPEDNKEKLLNQVRRMVNNDGEF